MLDSLLSTRFTTSTSMSSSFFVLGAPIGGDRLVERMVEKAFQEDEELQGPAGP